MRGSRKNLQNAANNTRSKHQLNKHKSTVNTNRGVEVSIDPTGKQPENNIENFMFNRDFTNPAFNKTGEGPINVSVSRVNSIIFDD